MWRAVILSYWHLLTTSKAANIAAYGDASSLSALTFIPPVTLARVSLPVRSVTWINVSFHVARIWQTAKTCSSPVCWGPSEVTTFCCTASPSSPSAALPFPLPLVTFFYSMTGSSGFTVAISVD
jgi:hypothetical protein